MAASRMASACWMLAFAIAILSTSSHQAAAQIPDVVIHLNGDTFEHHTQASTGQTAGAWFVLFNAWSSARHEQASELWATLAQDEDKEVIFAQVALDDTKNRLLARQFQDIQPPSAVLFRDRGMYVFPGSLAAEGAEDKVRAFWQGTYKLTEKQAVPSIVKPPVLKAAKRDGGSDGINWRMIILGGLLLLGGLSIHAAVFYVKAKQENAAKPGGAKAKKSN